MDSPSRRAVLATGGALILTGCLPATDLAAARPDPDLRLRRRVAREVASLVAAYAAAVAAFPAAAAALSALAAEHEAHLRALEGPPPSGSAPTAAAPPAASTAPPPAVPSTLGATRRWLAGLERAAAHRRTGEALQAGPDLARLLAAVAACEVTHAALLDRGGRG